MNKPTTAEPEPARILIVEDERIVALDLAGTLNELGYSVVGMAARGWEAVERAQQLEPQLILMDVRLAGDLDGIQTAQLIRQRRDIPIVYLTAHSDSETLRRAADTAASGYLVKPFKSPELRCAIEIALHKHAVDSKLRESEQWLSTTMRSIAEAVIATDASGRVRLFNPIAEYLTGWPHDEAKARPVDEILTFVDEHSGVPIDNLVKQVLESGKPKAIEDGSVLVSRSGHTVHVEESAAPIMDNHGHILGTVLVLRDITERRRYTREIEQLNQDLERRVVQRTAALEAANHELESFSYSVAHDLRTPLRGINGFSQLLIDRHATQLDAVGLGYLHRVRAAAARMSQLIDALLALARVGRTELHPVHLNLSDLVRSLVSDIAGAHPEHVVNFSMAEGVEAYADPQLLRLALYNLLDNAWKFTSRRPDAAVEVGMCSDPSVPTYFVRDNGAGFDANHAQQLFGAFQRMHSEKEFPGTGIGLAIVQRVIVRHGGSVWATSKPHQGATFFFTLPAPLH